ncbi:MAG: CoA transferase [Hyphomonadaceae bacterium]
MTADATYDGADKTPAFGALAGVRVIDFTQMLAGPYCTMMLGDQGAEIIKIEPLHGDTTRYVGPFIEKDAAHEFGGYFHSVNRNKKSLTLNLKSDEARKVVLELVRGADIVVENYRVGVMDKFGLSYEELIKVNPKLVYCSIRGYGDPRLGESPYADWPAYDVTAQALGGMMGITGPAPDQPMKIGPGVGDIIPAMTAAFGILAALHKATASGKGQLVDIAMYDAVLAVCERIVYQHSYTGGVPHPEGNSHPLLSPFGLFPAKDGWVSLACPNDRFWGVLCQEIGEADLIEHADFATNFERAACASEVYDRVCTWTKPLTKEEMSEKLGGKLPFAPVNGADDIFADPHTEARNMLANVEIPGTGETIKLANTPVKMSMTQGGVKSRSPRLGEHNAALLGEVGLSVEEIEQLKTDGVTT